MNNIIRNLAEQAIEEIDIVYETNVLNEELEKMYIPDCFVEMFAELIIQECIKSVEELYIPPNDIRNSKDYGCAQWWEGYDDRGSDSTDAIKKHFGVDEK